MITRYLCTMLFFDLPRRWESQEELHLLFPDQPLTGVALLSFLINVSKHDKIPGNEMITR